MQEEEAMTVSLDERAFATPRALTKNLGDEIVLLDLETETYFGLNPIGSRFWHLATTAPTIKDAIAAMTEEYDVAPDELERDRVALLLDLVGCGLLRIGRE